MTQNRLSLEAFSQGRDFSQSTSYDLSSLTSCMDEAYYDLPEDEFRGLFAFLVKNLADDFRFNSLFESWEL